MLIIDVEKRSLNFDDYVQRSAQEEDFRTLINKDALIRIDGKPAILYRTMSEWNFEPLRKCLMRLKYDTSTRSSGLKTTSKVFGYQPRIPMRRDFCTKTSLAQKQKAANDLICGYGEQIAEIYAGAFPEVFEQHREWTQGKVRNEWKIEKTPFTSGIVNKNNPLKYHFDRGNIAGVCSCMLALKSSSGGGYLSLPELGLGLEIGDKSLTIFDGQSLLHGVTPIRKITELAHRFTVVYYTLHQMWQCEPLTEELARIRQVKSNRERKRAGILEQGGVLTQHGLEDRE